MSCIRSGCASTWVVIDSVAALTPRAEIEGEMGDTHVGLQARLMSQALRKLTGNGHRSPTPSGASSSTRSAYEDRRDVRQPRDHVRVGNALKFYSSRAARRAHGSSAIKDGDEVVGNRTRVKVVKNKVAPPFRQAEFDILYNEGISTEGDLLDLGVDAGIVEKSGAWYSYESDRIGQGRENARRFLKENVDMCARLADAVYAAKGLKRQVPVQASEASEKDAQQPDPASRRNREAAERCGPPVVAESAPVSIAPLDSRAEAGPERAG